MPKLDIQTTLLAFAAIVGLAVVLQTILLLVISVAVKKAIGSIQEEIENLRSSVMPVIYDTRDLISSSQAILSSTQDFIASAQGMLGRMAPKVETAVENLADITLELRTQTAEVQASAREVIEKVRRQSDRLDSMFTDLLNTVDRAGGYVTDVVSKPIKQISGILGSFKSIVESLRRPVGSRRPIQPPTDGNRFF